MSRSLDVSMSTPAPLARFGDLLLLELLDGFGALQTFRASDPEGRLVRVRGVRAASIDDPALLEAFAERVALAQSLALPQLEAPIRHALTPVPHVVLDLATGAELGQALAAREGEPMPPEAVVEIGLAVVRALAAIHARGATHGAVSPESVFITGAGDARLTDLGLGLLAQQVGGSAPSSPVSMLRYLSPERGVSAAGDLWGLGVTLFECLAGRPAFDADKASVLRMQIAAGATPALPPGVPDALALLVRQMLSVDPGGRPVAADVVTAFSELRDALPDARAILPSLPPAAASPEHRRTVEDGLDLAALGISVPRVASAAAPAPPPSVGVLPNAPPFAGVLPRSPAPWPDLPPLPMAPVDDEPTIESAGPPAHESPSGWEDKPTSPVVGQAPLPPPPMHREVTPRPIPSARPPAPRLVAPTAAPQRAPEELWTPLRVVVLAVVAALLVMLAVGGAIVGATFLL